MSRKITTHPTHVLHALQCTGSRAFFIFSVTATVAALAPGNASASERHFTYTYGSDVLRAGQLELEPWTTARIGREEYFVRMDHRLEFEVGLTDALQTAWYLKWHSVTKDVEGGRESEFEWDGVSWEWKWKLMDPVADALGLALYFEPGFAPNEVELEAKIIVDRRFGDFLFAANVVGELELELEKEKTAKELIVEFDLGLAYFVTPALSLGIEFRNHNEIVDGELEHGAFFAGPAIAYATSDWWAAMTVFPQIGAISEHAVGGIDLHEHERIETRLLFGVHL